MIQQISYKAVRFFYWVWFCIKSTCKIRKTLLFVKNDDGSVTRYRPDGRVDIRVPVNNNADNAVLFENVPPPWLMIQKNGVDRTEALASYVCKGNHITLDFLRKTFGDGKWAILNSKTFNEEDFPSGGIIIK